MTFGEIGGEIGEIGVAYGIAYGRQLNCKLIDNYKAFFQGVRMLGILGYAPHSWIDDIQYAPIPLRKYP